ncbi:MULTISPECIES: phosphonate ABC transporter, permease protein PhnE [Stappiaceae]|jgi:phosphonate transport system permease protein|uniref:phosphonate ABC transporter, permease protein PhnE n=1 Tax=Stappiaceae TaxID=2821832 RepID=UPI0012680A59|nr:MULTISPECIES: phosphonate ABC transporter, permease protein PhnE [Stappiaceae]MCR9280046.1 phosphonate ABC transporter, permease protein PhnE [Paracoccaceae bacterium]MEC9401677.1 phosphonate ABC transporter, permease protein PhnE [Pseudomonadota bacterium]MBO6858040.1 phosphonate ABC transporter, permease protein PhnE [Roseibium sp.]MBO9458382.1 phosphonate ABC transporter, permease protein PhnE [Labrenzia sp. R5_0]MEC9473011.1 phosphonate ABC transporter, permease protein PhnE [Pseudomona
MTVDTLETPVTQALVWNQVRRRAWLTVVVPLAIFTYLVYTWFAFGVPELLSRAQPERAVILATDSVAYKVHVTKSFRDNEFEVAIEGERTATYDNAKVPDWVQLSGENGVVDLGDGYKVEIDGRTALFTIPGYGVVEGTATADGVETVLPAGPAPDWIKIDPRKLDVRPTLDRRLQVTKTKIEVHNYFGGWENFWFPFRSPLYGMSFSQLYALALSSDRMDPETSNIWFIVNEFLENPDWQHGKVLTALFETIMMAVLGTLTAAFFGLPLAFLAARNFTPSKLLRFGTRRLFDFLRGIDMLIWSLIFIRAFGLGPLTGALAIAFTDTGSLGKLFSEALENIDNKQVEGVRATGANQIQRYRYGVIPQILPVFVSQVLYYLESNTRSATVIGALGAGGIGLLLVETMKTSRDWENTSYIIILTIIVVILMDQTSGWLRRKLIEGK